MGWAINSKVGKHAVPPQYVTKPTRSTQPCIPPGSLNRVLALTGWGKGGNVTSAGWQVTLCDPIWHVSSCSSEAVCKLLYSALPFLKPVWILLKQETVNGSSISWAICKPTPRPRQITIQASHHSVFYRPDALPVAQSTASKHWRYCTGWRKKTAHYILLSISLLNIDWFS